MVKNRGESEPGEAGENSPLPPYSPTPLLFIFLDGVGLGADAQTNPFLTARMPFLESLLGGKLTASLAERLEPGLVFKHLDASLGYDGLPQSATGQATLLTGKNAADVMGRHYGPWPGPSLKKWLAEGTLFSELTAQKLSAILVNVYPPGYFKALEAGKHKVNVPVFAALQAGLSLKTLEDYQKGEAISVDFSGRYLQRYEPSLPSYQPEEAGKQLASLAKRHHFSFFDYWPSDQVGHRGSFEEAVELLEMLDAFLRGVMENLGDATCLITSDHGNLEDKSSKTHTEAAVPLLVVGKKAGAFATNASLLEVAPSIRTALKDA